MRYFRTGTEEFAHTLSPPIVSIIGRKLRMSTMA